MTKYPIVATTTPDGIDLPGLLLEPHNPTDTIYIHIHGSAGNFYWNNFKFQLCM